MPAIPAGAAPRVCRDRGCLQGLGAGGAVLNAIVAADEAETIPSEHMEQARLVSWFRQTYRGVLIFAIPNGGLRGKREAQKLKVEGVTPGVPDLAIPAWGLWVEMKRQKGGKLSPDQKDMITYLESIGHTVLIGYGCDDARAKIISYVCKNNLHTI